MPAAPDFHVHSFYSIIDGMGSPADTVKRAKELGWGAVSLTEHGWIGSVPALYKAAKAEKIKPILGCEFYVVPDELLGVKGKDTRNSSFHLTVLALNAEGYHNLVHWTTFSSQPENSHYNPRISIEKMVELAPYGLENNVVLSGCLGSELCSHLKTGGGIDVAGAYIMALKSVFPHFYIEIQNHEHPKFLEKGFSFYETMVEEEAKVRKSLVALAQTTHTKTVLTNDSHFQTVKQRETHLMMTSAKRSRGGPKRSHIDFLPEYGYLTNYMQSMEKIAERTPELPQDALENALEIVDMADVRLAPLDEFKYSIPFSGYDDPIKKIKQRSLVRLHELKKKYGQSAVDRFNHELSAMGDFAHYLLLMSDFIINAKSQGILTNTRGSAANSILCYCLRIHDIDSIGYQLVFERFYNPDRKKLPDIDIDIEKDRYQDFMGYVIERMKELEGEGNVVMICNYGTFANRSAFRLIAEQLGIPKEEADEIAKLLPQMIDSGMVDEESDVYEALKEDYPEIYEYASGIFDQIKSISQHACGWLFGTRDRPISEWVPLCLISSSGQLVTQYNMKSLEDMGLNKGDFLRLRTLSVIQRCRRLLGQDSLDITDIPLDDPKTFQMLREGRTEGVFTLQGKSNRQGVIECEVETVEDVIASVAIYRPALTRVGGDKLYNARRKGDEVITYAHPVAEKVLGPTYGVPIFQEQILQLAQGIGMTNEESQSYLDAIKMAKGVGRGAKEAFAKVKPVFMERALKMMGEEDAEAVWGYIANFEGYGFNRGHSTSYGMLAVRAAYLKANHPAEFFTALLDVYPEKAKYIAAARAEGFHFLPPDVNVSGRGFHLDNGSIRVGLERVKGLGPAAIGEVLAGQPYYSLEDFKSRTTRRVLNKTRIETLAELGAFGSLGVKGTADDQRQFEIMGFTINKPKVFKGIKVAHANARVSQSGWKHTGLERTAELTEGRESVSKLFWIPEIEKVLEYKTSPYAQVKTALLTAIDINGLPFQIMANEDKEGEVRILEVLAKKFRGSVICADGAVRQPFLTDGPMGFRFYGVTGADYNKDPQVWQGGVQVNGKLALGLIGLHEIKRQLRAAA